MAVSPFAPPLPVCGIGGLLHDLHHGLVGGFRDFVPWAATQQLGWPFDISGRKISGNTSFMSRLNNDTLRPMAAVGLIAKPAFLGAFYSRS